MPTALLLSGGIDSISVAYWKRPQIAVTVDYGQKPAEGESQASAEVCRVLGIEHTVVNVNCSALGSGDMAGLPPLAIAPVPEWWPFRNQLLITLAAAHLLPRAVSTLLMGTVKSDAVHVDGTPAFTSALSQLMMMQEGEIQVQAPAIDMTSAELVRASAVPMEVLAWAHSCHVANLACGRCRGCAKHFETMKELGIGPY